MLLLLLPLFLLLEDVVDELSTLSSFMPLEAILIVSRLSGTVVDLDLPLTWSFVFFGFGRLSVSNELRVLLDCLRFLEFDVTSELLMFDTDFVLLSSFNCFGRAPRKPLQFLAPQRQATFSALPTQLKL